MDTRFLESFLVVAESGSVAEAARRLDLTPASLAQRIRALETELGIRLLIRAGRTVQPTEAGRTILSRAQQLLRDARELRAIACADAPSGQLRIGAMSTALTGVLPPTLSLLRRSSPQIDIYVTPGVSPDLYKRVLNGEIDAAIIVQPPFALRKACDWMLLRQEPLVILSPRSVPIVNPRALLSTEPFIRYDRKHWGGRLADNYLQQQKIKPNEKLELDALEAIAILVDRGLGVSLVPDWPAPWPEGLALNKKQINAPAFMRRVGLLWMRNSPNMRLINAFRMQARAALGI